MIVNSREAMQLSCASYNNHQLSTVLLMILLLLLDLHRLLLLAALSARLPNTVGRNESVI